MISASKRTGMITAAFITSQALMGCTQGHLKDVLNEDGTKSGDRCTSDWTTAFKYCHVKLAPDEAAVSGPSGLTTGVSLAIGAVDAGTGIANAVNYGREVSKLGKGNGGDLNVSVGVDAANQNNIGVKNTVNDKVDVNQQQKLDAVMKQQGAPINIDTGDKGGKKHGGYGHDSALEPKYQPFVPRVTLTLG